MRSLATPLLTLAVALAGALPSSAQDESNGFPYVPVRGDLARSAGYLTEGRPLPFGRLLGAVTPVQIRASTGGAMVALGESIEVRAPEGATYKSGDTLLIAQRMPAPKGWGEIVLPTGLAVVGASSNGHTVAAITAIYGPIRNGQVLLPVEPVANPGAVKPVKADGPTGHLIGSRDSRELLIPTNIVFIDIGKAAGIRLGDFVEFRRKAAASYLSAGKTDDLMARGQVVLVNEKHASVILTGVTSPDIPPGTTVVRTATLPN